MAIKKNLRTKEIYVETVKNNVRERERKERYVATIKNAIEK